ncbi:MAG TPA: gamma-glutamylcyclotransferase family protein [Phenylobacterium sp.]|nr:gamma-glutamylcyclotransferase family protein [Phenylobacterium sp.]
MAFGPEHRLVVYGSLAPGKANHLQLAGLDGEWRPGRVRGWFRDAGWGTDQGFPGLTPDPAGPEVAVQVFWSMDLPAHWPRLDAFEGADYRRVPIAVTTEDGVVEAHIYAVAVPRDD